MPQIIEQPFTLNQDDPVLSVADGVASTWSDIWKYQCPVGLSLIIKPEHTLALFLAVAGPAEIAAAAGTWNTGMVRVEKRDASGSDVQVIAGPRIYRSFRQFADQERLAHFNVPAEGVIINEREYFVILAYDDGTISETVCYFEARIAKVRKALGA